MNILPFAAGGLLIELSTEHSVLVSDGYNNPNFKESLFSCNMQKRDCIVFTSEFQIPQRKKLQSFFSKTMTPILAPGQFKHFSVFNHFSQANRNRLVDSLLLCGVSLKTNVFGEDLSRAFVTIADDEGAYHKASLDSEIDLGDFAPNFCTLCQILDLDFSFCTEDFPFEKFRQKLSCFPEPSVLILTLFSLEHENVKLSVLRILNSIPFKPKLVLIKAEFDGAFGIRTFGLIKKNKYIELKIDKPLMTFSRGSVVLRSFGNTNVLKQSYVTSSSFLPGESIKAFDVEPGQSLVAIKVARIEHSKRKLNVGPIASSSAANCMILTAHGHNKPIHLLLDAGVKSATLQDYRKKFKTGEFVKVKKVALSHGHKDHCNEELLLRLNKRKRKVEFFPSFPPLSEFLGITLSDKIKPRRLGSFSVSSCRVEHGDTRSLAMKVRFRPFSLSYVTDCGAVNNELVDLISGSEIMCIEFNSRFNRSSQFNGKETSRHLSNDKATELLLKSNIDSLRLVMPLHLSLSNNSIGEVLQSILLALKCCDPFPLVLIPPAMSASGKLHRSGAIFYRCPSGICFFKPCLQFHLEIDQRSLAVFEINRISGEIERSLLKKGPQFVASTGFSQIASDQDLLEISNTRIREYDLQNNAKVFVEFEDPYTL